MLGLDVTTIAVLLIVVSLGAVVQGIIGLGLGLVAAPVMTMLTPDLVPVTLLLLSLLLPIVTLLHDRRGIDWRGLAWALPGRIPGTVIGAWLVTTVSARLLGIMVGTVVVLAVALTWRTVKVPVTRGTLVGAGVISGVTGTATSIGGPPLALLYQHRSPEIVRSTLAVYFVVGGTLSLSALMIGGAVEPRQIAIGVLLVPALILGTFVAGRIRRRVDPASLRPLMLAACATSAIVLIVRSSIA